MPEKYIVPQFIDNENKILGPITVRQFMIVLGAVFLLFILYSIFSFVVFIAFAIFIVPIAATFAFVKINGQPFHLFAVNVLQTQMRPKIRVWNKEKNDAEIRAYIKNGAPKETNLVIPPAKSRPDSTKLRDLTLIVNTGGVYNPDDQS